MNTRIFVLLSLLILLLTAGHNLPAQPAAGGGVPYFVATTGDDANPGTREKPFASLEVARDAVRKLKAAGDYPAAGVTVNVRGGVYERKAAFVLGPDDSGTATAPVVYQSAPGETARLVGGRAIPATAFTPAASAFSSRVTEPAARRHILEMDLKALGITDYGRIQPQHAVDFGSPTHYVVAPLELFVDGQPMTLARWPNRDETNPRTGFIDAARVKPTLDPNGKPKEYAAVAFKDVPANYGDGDVPGLAPIHAHQRLRQWKNVDDAWFAGGLVRSYAYTQRQIAAVNPESGEVTLATPVPVWATWDQKVVNQTFFFNVQEELDTPGEYYVDRKTGKLYLYPPAGWSGRSTVLVSQLTDVLVALEGSSHVRLRGLTLEATRASAVVIAGGEDNVLEDCEIRNAGLVGVQIGMGYDADKRQLLPRLPGEYRGMLCTGMENHSTHPRGGTALNRQGGRANGLLRCRIHDTGCGGVLLGGGDRKTLEPAGNFVRDSEIFRTDRLVNRYAEAIVVDGVGNHISGNYLHDSDGGILYIHGNDHLIEYNEIARAIKTSQDCGAVEIRQNPSQLGNKIRFNYLHDTSRLDVNAHTNVIYLDNESHGVEIFGNVFQRIGGRSVDPYGRNIISANGGHNHIVANNLFLDNSGCKVGDGHEFAKTQAVFANRRVMLTGDVDVTQPPYATRYPAFLATYAGGADTQLYNEVYNNVLVGCGSGVGESRYPDAGFRHHNLETSEDPGFVNPAAGNFSLRPDSRVFTEIPGFQPIPFEKMRQAHKWSNESKATLGVEGND